MDFTEEAFVLSARAHGDTGVVVDLLTETHGRRSAYVAGGASRRMKPFLQAGARVAVDYRARTSDHLGSARLEPVGEGATSVVYRATDPFGRVVAVKEPRRELAVDEHQPAGRAFDLMMLDLVGRPRR